MYIAYEDFLADKDTVRHAFFGRRGGISRGGYESLNIHPKSGDNPDYVRQNRARIAQEIGVQPDYLLTPDQCHSARCVMVHHEWSVDHAPAADALVTDLPGYGLGVMTADCAPVLLYSEKADGAPVIGACHAGWQGALGGVIGATIHAMLDMRAELALMQAAIGPCIQQSSYEVDGGFRARFLEMDPPSEGFFVRGEKFGFYQFDLPGYVSWRLSESGVPYIAQAGIDTYDAEPDYFSYRRATHRGEGDYGRQMSVIAISS